MPLITPESPYLELVAGLRGMGYQGALLQENYGFGDWFSQQKKDRRVAAAAFGQTPISYDSACIGIVHANGLREQDLVDSCRALGAPIILEIDEVEVREWAVSARMSAHGLIGRYPSTRIGEALASRASDWKRDSLFRAKNIGSFRWTQQLGLFAGLLPELEGQIQAKLDPLLRETLSLVQDTYRDITGGPPDPAKLFKLVFWILTAKVFHDRQVPGFVGLSADPDKLLSAVGRQYKMPVPLLLNKESRQVAASRIWDDLDFRNLSVEVLSQIWPTTLVDSETRKRLGIHRTSRTIVRYIVERIPFNRSGDDGRTIFEPCSGSAAFLIGMMNVLRQNLFGMTPSERHRYFIKHLSGIEKEPFGVEISRLALTLADFPNPDGWDITPADVFEPGILSAHLQKAAVVLCNPPFENFTPGERLEYNPSSIKKPDELLRLILKDLPADGVLGFVLPRIIIDGRGYAPIRRQLAERFATLEFTILPDRAFDADSEIALLVATEPIPHNTCFVANRKVADSADAWRSFELAHEVSTDFKANLSVEEAERYLILPALPDVWSFLVNYPSLCDVADVHRGIEWNLPLKTKEGRETGNRSLLVRHKPETGYEAGVAPQATFKVFEEPPISYLSFHPEYQRGNAAQREWDRPKVILKKSARSRGKWRMAAFPDSRGLTCYQTCTGVWPKSNLYDEVILSAVLNSPVANAFVATREGKTDITKETLQLIPVPHFTDSQRGRLKVLVAAYQNAISNPGLFRESSTEEPEMILKAIDALVLDGYRMPPKLECEVLEFFRGDQQHRPTAHTFGEYLPAGSDVYFSLSEYLSPDFASATSDQLLRRMGVR